MSDIKLKTLDDERARAIAFFGALCLFFSTLEYLIPKPNIPFFRLGLANLPILLAFPVFRGRDIVLLTVLKVLGQGLINGTLASYVFLFSLGGSVASVVFMYAAWKLFGDNLSFLGLSLIGALASNTVQIVLSLTFIFGTTAWVIAPLFMGLGLLAGVLVGIAAIVFEKNSLWYAELRGGLPQLRLPKPLAPVEEERDSDIGEGAAKDPQTPPLPSSEGRNNQEPSSRRSRKQKLRKKRWQAPPEWDLLGRAVSPPVLFWAGLLILPAYLFTENLVIRVAEVGGLMLLAVLAGRRLQFLYFINIVLSITFFNLFAPAGKVLLSIGPFAVTEHALVAGLSKGLGIVGLVFLSLATIRRELVLPGKLGALLGGQFLYYEAILSRRSNVSRKSLIDSVDNILRESSLTEEVADGGRQLLRTSKIGWFFVISFVLLPWIALFLVNFARAVPVTN